MRTVVLKLAALPLFAFAFFVAYTFSLPFAQSLLPAADEFGIGLFIAAVGLTAIVLAAVWGLAFALPLAWVYRGHAASVAAVCVVPLLLVFVAQYFNRPGASFLAQLPVVFFVVTLAVIVPGAAHVMDRLLRSHNKHAA